MEITPYKYPVCFSIPKRLTADSAWIEHIPFVGFLVSVLRPRTFVELGSHSGVSYCAVCQAVDELGLDTQCIAVDTWQGDPHSGSYGPEILDDLRRHHDPLYGRFSRLMQATFDEALTTVENGSVDLLHIDGNHTYQAVKRDFETWLPKLSQRGIVLFHDIAVRRDNFGVWKYWGELALKYQNFAFTHGYGLGVLGVGGELPADVRQLLTLSPEDAEITRRSFYELGRAMTLRADAKRVMAELNGLRNEVDRLSSTVQAQEKELNRIHYKLARVLVKKYQRIRDKLFPLQSRRRAAYSWADTKVRKVIEHGLINLVYMKYWPYRFWITKNEPTRTEFPTMQAESKAWSYRPLVSLITPVFNPTRYALTQCLQSVVDQIYENWELCIVDGGSDQPYVREIIERFARNEARIKFVALDTNRGIAGNSNEALRCASGDYVGLLDHDDTLAPFALYEVVKLLNQSGAADFIYSDEDKVPAAGTKRYDPEFKSGWAPDTLLSYNYLCHFAVVRKRFLDEVGGFREGYDGAQDYDLMLRVVEKTRAIQRIPKVLYHWRAAAASTAAGVKVKPYAVSAAKRAIAEHLTRRGLDAEVLDGDALGSYRVKYRLRPGQSVSVIVPTKDKVHLLEQCVSSVLAKTSYERFKLLIVDNGSEEPETLAYFDQIKHHAKIRVVRYDRPFNFSAINNYAVRADDSEYLVFLNNDTEVISADWVGSMLEFAQRDDVGAVGAKLYYPNDTIQHAGTIVGYWGVADHAHKHYLRSARGYMGRINIVQNLSAVTAACMMVRRKVFDEVGGFDEAFSHSFNDVDLCLRIRERGRLIVYTPYAELYHHESVSRGYDEKPEGRARLAKEVELMKSRWKHVLEAGDPYYSPNLTLEKTDFSLRI